MHHVTAGRWGGRVTVGRAAGGTGRGGPAVWKKTQSPPCVPKRGPTLNGSTLGIENKAYVLISMDLQNSEEIFIDYPRFSMDSLPT